MFRHQTPSFCPNPVCLVLNSPFFLFSTNRQNLELVVRSSQSLASSIWMAVQGVSPLALDGCPGCQPLSLEGKSVWGSPVHLPTMWAARQTA